MSYVVYVNNPTNKALVHRTSCTRYIGRKAEYTHNGYWTEPVSDFEMAMTFAKNTGKARVDTCSYCL